MAIPTIVSSSANIGGGSQTISPGAGLTFVFIVTEAQNLPSALSTQISHASSGWTAIVGTKGGAGYSAASLYLYLFVKVTDGVETIATGDSGTINAFTCVTVSGYHASQYEALTTGSGTFGTSSQYTFTHPSLTTLGPERLIVHMVAPRADTTSTVTVGSTLENPKGAQVVQTNLSGGGGANMYWGGLTTQGPSGSTVEWQSLAAAYNGAAVGYVTLAVIPANVTLYGTASLSGTGSLTSAGVRTSLGAATASGTGSLTAAGSRQTFGTATASGTGSLSASGVRTAYDSAFPTGVGALTASGVRTTLGAVDASGIGSLSATGTRTVPAQASLDGTGALAASGSVITADDLRRRRLFAADPMLTGSPMRSSIDFTK